MNLKNRIDLKKKKNNLSRLKLICQTGDLSHKTMIISKKTNQNELRSLIPNETNVDK
jgi:hypothetical protein